jgi:hypothetical protein
MGLANSPDKPGIKLAKTVSWEQTVEDFVAALRGKALADITKSRYLVVRLGLEGALCCERPGCTSRQTTLWFAPECIEGEYADGMGEFPGLTTVFMAVIARGVAGVLAESKGKSRADLEDRISVVINTCVKDGLRAARRYFDLGYGPTPETVRKIARLELPISQVFSSGRIIGLRDEGQHRFVSCNVHEPPDGRSEGENWSILTQYIGGDTADLRSRDKYHVIDNRDESELDDFRTGISVGKRHDEIQGIDNPSAFRRQAKELLSRDHEAALGKAVRAVALGRGIVLHGVEAAFRRFSIGPFPYAKIGDLVAVDRREIEGLRSIRNVFAEYIRHKERKTPLSVAVFGPPGSGKSFGVKQIASFVTKNKIREFVFNLAQFTSFQELTRQLLKVRDEALDDRTPLVFFDEFDASYGTQPLGWLKFFLSPMQDGRFQHEDSMLGIGKAIFVFAGGIAPSHKDFIHPPFWESSSNQGDPKIFSDSKGPDFHSRLRGFLDIVGPNPDLPGPLSDDTPKAGSLQKKYDRFADEDFTFVIRRAVLLRQIIEHICNTAIPRLLDREGFAEIDRDVLDALLLTDAYLHGVRSLHAIFEMSAMQDEQALTKTSLPSREQLLMHVHPSFYDILVRDYAKLKSGILERLFDYDREIGGIGEASD